MKSMSICIPTYEMGGRGHIFLKQSFNVFSKQTFKDFDIVISDHSKNTLIKDLCDEYAKKIDIKYYKNPEKIGNYSFNLNNAIKKATGKLVKILLQDDFLYNENSLQEIHDNFNIDKDKWLFTACVHTKNRIDFFDPFYPKYNKKLYLGKNTLGSPTTLTILNNEPLLLDENLIWLNDCDYYKRYYDTYGEPKLLQSIGVVVGIGDHQITNTIATQKLRQKEFFYVLQKYEKGFQLQYHRLIGFLKYPLKKLRLLFR